MNLPRLSLFLYFTLVWHLITGRRVSKLQDR